MTFKTTKDFEETLAAVESEDQYHKIPDAIRNEVVNEHYGKLCDQHLHLDAKTRHSKDAVDKFQEKLLELETDTESDWTKIPIPIRQKKVEEFYKGLAKEQLESLSKKTLKTSKPKRPRPSRAKKSSSDDLVQLEDSKLDELGHERDSV